MGYRKQIKGQNISADEQFSHNSPRINLILGGAGMMLAGFIILCGIAAIIWMMTHQSGLLAILVVSTFIIGFLSIDIVAVCFAIRYVSGTIRQFNSDKAAKGWDEDVLYTDSQVISRNPRLLIENAREIQQTYHMKEKPQVQVTEVAQSLHDDDLEDDFSQVLGRRING